MIEGQPVPLTEVVGRAKANVLQGEKADPGQFIFDAYELAGRKVLRDYPGSAVWTRLLPAAGRIQVIKETFIQDLLDDQEELPNHPDAAERAVFLYDKMRLAESGNLPDQIPPLVESLRKFSAKETADVTEQKQTQQAVAETGSTQEGKPYFGEVRSLTRYMLETLSLTPEQRQLAMTLIGRRIEAPIFQNNEVNRNNHTVMSSKQVMEVFRKLTTEWGQIVNTTDEQVQQRTPAVAEGLKKDFSLGQVATEEQIQKLGRFLVKIFAQKDIRKAYPKVSEYVDKVGSDKFKFKEEIRGEVVAILYAINDLVQITKEPEPEIPTPSQTRPTQLPPQPAAAATTTENVETAATQAAQSSAGAETQGHQKTQDTEGEQPSGEVDPKVRNIFMKMVNSGAERNYLLEGEERDIVLNYLQSRLLQPGDAVLGVLEDFLSPESFDSLFLELAKQALVIQTRVKSGDLDLERFPPEKRDRIIRGYLEPWNQYFDQNPEKFAAAVKALMIESSEIAKQEDLKESSPATSASSKDSPGDDLLGALGVTDYDEAARQLTEEKPKE